MPRRSVKARYRRQRFPVTVCMLCWTSIWSGWVRRTSLRIPSSRIAPRCGYFLEWCRERGLDDVTEITRPVLERYQRSLYQYRKKNGEPLTFRTQNTRLRSVKGWFRWLARQNHLLHNPASELILPRLENRLPKYILNAEEAETVLQQPDMHTTRRPARSRDSRNVLLDRHAAAGSGESEALRHRPRARHGDDPAGQGEEGPAHSDRRARAGAGSRSTSARRGRICSRRPTTARCFWIRWASRSTACI